MSLARRARPASPLEIWTVRSSVGLAIFGLSFLAWAMADIDRDGLSSIQEIRGDTNPLDADSDGDGAADGWETKHGGKNAASDPGLLGAVEPECIELLKACPPPADQGEPEPPRTSTSSTSIATGVAGIVAAFIAVLAAAWAGRRIS